MVGGLECTGRADDERAGAALDAAAETLEHLDVRVDLANAQAATFDVVLDARHAEAGEQRRHQHDRRAHLFGQTMALLVEVRVAVADIEHAAGEVDFDLAAEHAEDLDDLLHVGDLWDAAQAHRLTRQQRGAQDGQHGVLVRRRRDAAAQWRAAVDDEVGHGWS